MEGKYGYDTSERFNVIQLRKSPFFHKIIFRNFSAMGCDSSQMTTEVQPHPADNVQNLPSLTKVWESIAEQRYDATEKMADQYFASKNYLQAIKIYQKIIENGYKVDFEIHGLGNAELAISRYEWFVYRWYSDMQKKGLIRGNVFDSLSLCYSLIRNSNEDQADRGILWYEDMLAERQCYQLLFGYANLLYNRGRYEEAIKVYNKLIEKKPHLINSYVSIALTYEYKRIEKSKSMAMANKVLQVDPNNPYAHFILARNEKDVDNKIAKLKIVADKIPDYVRVTNEIGICYGGTKKEYREAITWYQKCTIITPQYASCYNNIGVNHQLLKQFQEALKWYMRACEYDPEYKAAHVNASDVFDQLKYTDEQIALEIKNYSKLNPFYFYYYLGLAYYDKKKVDVSIKWYFKAMEINDKNYKLFNSMGISYDEKGDYKNGEEYYLKCIEANPKYYSAYYNLAILYKNQQKEQKAIESYKKAIQVNPRYSYAYNNLGNIYKNKQEYNKAIECYKGAVANLSTYTLAFANLAICYLKLDQYQDAFTAFARAKEILPTDNNNLSQSNKNFLKENLEKFDKEGEKWRKTGSINPEQQELLKNLIRSFQANFKQLYTSQASGSVSDEKALKPEIIEIVNILYQDQFKLRSIDRIFQLVKHIFHDDEECFHVIPQAFIQYFYNSTFKENKPILSVEEELSNMIRNISSRESGATVEDTTPAYSLNIKMKNFNPPNDCKVNLFKNTSFFGSYEALYSEIVKVNNQAEKSLPEFIEFVEGVRKRSNGIPYGVNMKLPKRAEQQFKVILRILEKMFKKEIDSARVRTIISKIDKQLKAGGNKISLVNIVHEIMDVWTKEITLILEERTKNQTETTCGISDLIRGKIMFNSVDDLAKALQACDRMCHVKGYQILQLDNRLAKKQTRDVVLKIQIMQAVCQFQLAMRQDQSKYHLIHSIYEIERSPLGCIFGSYLFMSKGFSYPILANCKDIEAKLKASAKPEDAKTVEAARFIITSLQEKQE